MVHPPLPMAELTIDDIKNVGKPDANMPEMETVRSGTQASARGAELTARICNSNVLNDDYSVIVMN